MVKDRGRHKKLRGDHRLLHPTLKFPESEKQSERKNQKFTHSSVKMGAPTMSQKCRNTQTQIDLGEKMQARRKMGRGK